MNPESTYLQHLDSIERIAAFVARRGHLNAEDTGEFVQIVRVRLFEDDYSIIRKFEGRSSFTTYLTSVILHLFHEWRVQQWGKWRPSAEAKRLGDKAVLLEQLLTRDGFTFDEVVKVLTVRSGADFTVSELEQIYARLPLRMPRTTLVSEDVSPEAMAVDGDADERVERYERERTARLAVTTLDGAFEALGPEDKLILQMRFWDAKKVPDIARILGLDQKKVYKRLEKLFAILRRALEAAGVSRAQIDQLIGKGDQDIRLGLAGSGESRRSGPSNVVGEKRVRGDEENEP